MSILSQLPADQFCTAQHIAPLVISSKLHVAAVTVEQLIKVKALHDHVVEFQEA